MTLNITTQDINTGFFLFVCFLLFFFSEKDWVPSLWLKGSGNSPLLNIQGLVQRKRSLGIALITPVPVENPALCLFMCANKALLFPFY